MKIDLKELGKRIKLTRKGQDLTQEMLAEKCWCQSALYL